MNVEGYPRMLSKEKTPDEIEISGTIGEKVYLLWQNLKEYIEMYYDYSPEIVFGGKNYGWMVRYRKSGKSLCSLYPEYGAFTALIVLGKKEVKGVLAVMDGLNMAVREAIVNTPQLHDGKWLWLRVKEENTVEDIKKLLSFKRKPKKL